MDIFRRNRFIVQPELKDVKDNGGIMDADKNLLCYIKHQHSWKGMITERRTTMHACVSVGRRWPVVVPVVGWLG